MKHWTKQSHAERAAAISALDSAGLRFAAIAGELGITPGGLHGYCFRMGIPHPGSAPVPLWATLSTNERIATVRSLDAAGTTPNGIASLLGTTYGSVVTFASRHRILLASSGRRMPKIPTFKIMPELALETWEPVHSEPACLLDRTGCCWPVGDAGGAEQMFCNGSIYRRGHCEHHHKMRTGASSEVMAAGVDGKPKHRTPIAAREAMQMAGVPARKREMVE